MLSSMVGLEGADKTTILYKLGQNVAETSSSGGVVRGGRDVDEEADVAAYFVISWKSDMDNKFGKYVFKFWSLKKGVGSNRTSDICYFLSNNVVARKTAKGVSKKAVTKDVNTQKIADKMEVKRRPLPDYIEKVQKDVSVNMRGVLVDWLVEVSEEYNLLAESLYLTISYIDRYLSLNVLNRQRLQLLGVYSMLIAS
ncbi:G2/mitotic-specific cyclin C13-1-like protein [Tanacetum coccineum]